MTPAIERISMKSKPPRKHYRPKKTSLPGMQQLDVRIIKDRLGRIEFIAHERLHLGQCTKQELIDIKDLFNCLLFCIMHRKKTLNQEAVDDAGNLLLSAGRALMEVVQKGEPRQIYVCTAQQLRLILSALVVAEDFIQESLSTNPGWFVDEFNASLLIRDAITGMGLSSVAVEKKTVDLAFRLSRRMGLCQPRSRFEIYQKEAIACLRAHITALIKKREGKENVERK